MQKTGMIKVSDEARQALKVYCALQNKTIKEVIEEMIWAKVDKNETPKN